MGKELEIATKMQLCQTSAKKLCQDKYPERIEGYIEMIQRYMKLKKCEILDAVIEICHFPDLRNDEYALMMFMAAGCEMIEKQMVDIKSETIGLIGNRENDTAYLQTLIGDNIVLVNGVNYLLSDDPIQAGDFVYNEPTKKIDRCVEIFSDGSFCVEFINGTIGFNRAILDLSYFKKAKPLVAVVDSEPLLIRPRTIDGYDEIYDLRYSGLTKRQRNAVIVPVRTEPKINRNQPCPCMSGKKYKQCCATIKK